MIMHGRKYSKIETTDYLKGEFIGDVPNWDGTQLQIEDPNNPGEYIDDPTAGITGKPTMPAAFIHVFDEATQTWGEGDPDAASKRLEQTKVQMIATIKTRCNAALRSMVETYPEFERATWSIQRGEAETYLSDNTAPTPFLEKLVVSRGQSETVAQLAQKVVAKAVQFESSAAIIGQRQRLEKLIKTLAVNSTQADIDAVQAEIDQAVW